MIGDPDGESAVSAALPPAPPQLAGERKKPVLSGWRTWAPTAAMAGEESEEWRNLPPEEEPEEQPEEVVEQPAAERKPVLRGRQARGPPEVLEEREESLSTIASNSISASQEVKRFAALESSILA